MSASTTKPAAVKNPLLELRDVGQSVWLDFIRRSHIASGGLKALVDDDGLGGVTSNPAIFEKAIAGSDDYKDAIEALAGKNLSPKDIFERLAIKDIQDAADILRPVYDRTAAADGYVSLEVAPNLAHDTEGTLAEARRLWKEVGRPNVMIKVPATPAGVPAIRALLDEGINVNITLLFAVDAYEAVARAYLEALEARVARGEAIDRIGSVASFFVSRIDSVVDTLVAEKQKKAGPEEIARLESLLGKVAVANAKVAYQSYRKLFSGPRWEPLKAKGARVQRVLWASTGTKNPRYRDVLYIEELIGPDTVNTVPPDTLDAFRAHGRVRLSLEEDLAGASATLATLEKCGISLKKITDDLLVDAVKKFVDPFAKLLQAVEKRLLEAKRA
jgi:transaldolase